MIARSITVWLVVSSAVLVLTLATQASEFELAYVGWALLLSLPVLISTQLGGLGRDPHERPRYPSAGLLILGAWILGVAPSLIADAPESHDMFRFSDTAMPLARLFFGLWCTLFAFASGRPAVDRLRITTRPADLIALSCTGLIIFTYLMRAGLFSAYQSSAVAREYEPGGQAATMLVLAGPLCLLLPPLSLLAATRPTTRTWRSAGWVAFAASWGILFLLTSRTTFAAAIAACLFVGRKLQRHLRPSVVATLATALVLVFLLITIYRTALVRSEEGATSVSQYLAIASRATLSLNEEQTRSSALDGFSENARARFFYGQQFCVVVDQWSEHGAALRGSFFAGLIRMVPTVLFPEKNDIAARDDFEAILHATGAFPIIDLGPMPWMQWLFEFGVLGLLIGPLLYGWLVRTIERRVSNTASFYEVAFWIQMFLAIWSPEQTTDTVLIAARSGLILILGMSGFAWVLDRLTRRVERNPTPA